MSMPTSQRAIVSLAPVAADEFEALVLLRIEAMRESLERVGRFDPERARQRFSASFLLEATRHVLWQGDRAGFVAVKREPQQLLLDHLYVHPRFQSRGIGSAVLAIVFQKADALRLPVRVGALRGSDSNRFYVRHGFVLLEEREWDVYYERPIAGAGKD
jgi:GNAT superfamily N-acetyltransferase